MELKGDKRSDLFTDLWTQASLVDAELAKNSVTYGGHAETRHA